MLIREGENCRLIDESWLKGGSPFSDASYGGLSDGGEHSPAEIARVASCICPLSGAGIAAWVFF
ncbi:hypothetical protein LB542_28580 [Mesorhizobium sp. BR1-1-9]|uniref:hypothetical protein n=1 Tax=unclassified Mesorhizobium TaxID=325217 RepID=UPI001CD088E0|nr:MULTISPECIES: hypothetical protein [unclassified Mesorhizobium]MBZ9874791.1 hypothetical protein [Mesorhizobium sp. BR1-1-9]MBZ9940465.1 hypothetical protein [Mesorhizobium sp. BR1-1-13]